MTDLLQEALATLSTWRGGYNAETVTYRAPGLGELELAATRGRRDYEVQDADGATALVESVDWLCEYADLELDDVPFEPAEGHTILATQGGTTQRYAVRRLGSRGCWSWSDAGTIRIHTKWVGAITEADE